MTLKAKLERLEELGDPVRVRAFTGPRDFTHALTLRTDVGDLCETELDLDAPQLDWWAQWQIIGCLVSYADDLGRWTERDALLYAAKLGLDEVLDVRIRQLDIALAGGL